MSKEMVHDLSVVESFKLLSSVFIQTYLYPSYNMVSKLVYRRCYLRLMDVQSSPFSYIVCPIIYLPACLSLISCCCLDRKMVDPGFEHRVWTFPNGEEVYPLLAKGRDVFNMSINGTL